LFIPLKFGEEIGLVGFGGLGRGLTDVSL